MRNLNNQVSDCEVKGKSSFVKESGGGAILDKDRWVESDDAAARSFLQMRLLAWCRGQSESEERALLIVSDIQL